MHRAVESRPVMAAGMMMGIVEPLASHPMSDSRGLSVSDISNLSIASTNVRCFGSKQTSFGAQRLRLLTNNGHS
jgi:hypothetical protein